MSTTDSASPPSTPPADATSPPSGSASRARIFISYSRKDAVFVERLGTALEALGLVPLIDRTEIYAFEDWWKRIEGVIGSADTIVFVLSPDAISSHVCEREVEFAASLNKKFAPIVCRPVDPDAVPSPLRPSPTGSAASPRPRAHSPSKTSMPPRTLDSVVFDMASGLRNVEGMRVETVRRITSSAEKAVGELASRTENDPAIRRSENAMYNVFSETYLRLGDTKLALDYAQKAVALARQLSAESPQDEMHAATWR